MNHKLKALNELHYEAVKAAHLLHSQLGQLSNRDKGAPTTPGEAAELERSAEAFRYLIGRLSGDYRTYQSAHWRAAKVLEKLLMPSSATNYPAALDILIDEF